MAGTSSKTPMHHHNLTIAVRSRQEKDIDRLVSSIQSLTNPFSEESVDFYNLVTKVVIPVKVKKNLGEQSAIGKELFSNFVKERIPASQSQHLVSDVKAQASDMADYRVNFASGSQG